MSADRPAIHVLRRLPNGSTLTTVVVVFIDGAEALRRWSATPRFSGHTVFSLQLVIPGQPATAARPVCCEALEAVFNTPTSLVVSARDLRLPYIQPRPRPPKAAPPLASMH